MSETSNPFAAMFEMQRRSMEQTQKAVHQSLNFQKQTAKLFRDSLHSQKAVQEKSMDVSQTAVEAYLDMLEATVPGDETAYDSMHEAVADQFEALHGANEETWAAFEETLEENGHAFEDFVDQYGEYLDDSVDAYMETLGQVEDQTEAATIELDE